MKGTELLKKSVKVNEKHILKLFVTGTTPNSVRAIVNLKRICEEYLCDNYQQPQLAQLEQILAAPVLVKKSPLPVRKLIGDMSNKQKVLKGLGLESK